MTRGGRGARRGGRAGQRTAHGPSAEPTLFELSQPGRASWQLRTTGMRVGCRRPGAGGPPARGAGAAGRGVRTGHGGHFTRLSHRQFSVDLGAYPLGLVHHEVQPQDVRHRGGVARFGGRAPGTPASLSQGWLEIFVELEEALCEVTGMAGATLQPAAGAAGELTGLAADARLHGAQGETRRGDHPRLRPRHQPRVGDPRWL